MSKKLLSFPYLLWMLGFTIIPLGLIVYFGLTDKTGAFTLANILAIATEEHAKALWLSLGSSHVDEFSFKNSGLADVTGKKRSH